MTGIMESGIGARAAARLTACALASALMPLPVVLIPVSAAAQQMRALPPAGELPQAPSQTRPGNPGSSLLPQAMPTPPASIPVPAPVQAQAVPQVPAGQVALMASARFGRDLPQSITGGLLWRVYPTRPDNAGVFRALKEDRNPSPTFVLP